MRQKGVGAGAMKESSHTGVVQTSMADSGHSDQSRWDDMVWGSLKGGDAL
jgi:hypothetical protein